MKKKKGKFDTCHRKNEEKGEFECPRSESFVFQRGHPNHALTLLQIFPLVQSFAS
jgi:hypothetical protein